MSPKSSLSSIHTPHHAAPTGPQQVPLHPGKVDTTTNAPCTQELSGFKYRSQQETTVACCLNLPSALIIGTATQDAYGHVEGETCKPWTTLGIYRICRAPGGSVGVPPYFLLSVCTLPGSKMYISVWMIHLHEFCLWSRYIIY